jgi:hypothetical protein
MNYAYMSSEAESSRGAAVVAGGLPARFELLRGSADCAGHKPATKPRLSPPNL